MISNPRPSSIRPAPCVPNAQDYAKYRNVAGTFENQMLYRMCADFPAHDDPYVVAGKITAIGRVYAASPTRGAGKPLTPGTSLVDYISAVRLTAGRHTVPCPRLLRQSQPPTPHRLQHGTDGGWVG